MYITSQLDLLLELLSMPRFKSTQDVPLLLVYSSELETEKYFAFWCACRAGKAALVVKATDASGHLCIYYVYLSCQLDKLLLVYNYSPSSFFFLLNFTFFCSL